MRILLRLSLALLVCGASSPSIAAEEAVKEVSIEAPGPLPVKVKMQGPYDAEVPLQIVCYFKHRASGDTTLGAAAELDNKLGGVIASLRDRGEFVGDELETFLLVPPKGTIKAEHLLLIGLGDEASQSLERMERVGRTALREAVKLGAARVAFAPLIRDQGDSRFSTGDVAGAVARGIALAYATEKRLQDEGLSKSFRIEEWSQQAGPKYFDETAVSVQKAVIQAGAAIKARSPAPHRRGGRQ